MIHGREGMGAVRFSLGRTTSEAEIDAFMDRIRAHRYAAS